MSEPELLGEIAAINASLNVIVADGGVIVGYSGAGADNDRAIEFLTTEPYDEDWHGRLSIGDADALVLSLDVGAGMATVYRLGPDRFAVVEPCQDGLAEEHEDDPDSIPADFAAQIASALRKPPEPPEPIGMIEIPSGILVVGDCYDSYREQSRAILDHAAAAPGQIVDIDDHLGSLAIRVSPGTYRVTRLKHDLDWTELGIAFIERQ